MAYIGRGLDKISNIEVLDAITFTDSAGPYNITQSSTAFVPASPNALVISIDGVVQDPGSYTTSVATITFDSVMAASSTMNFMYQIGVGVITAPSDGSVTEAKIATDAVTTAKIKDLNVTNAKIATGTIDVTAKITGVVPTANLGSGTASSTTVLYGDQTYKTISEYDDNSVQSNIAMLGFKVAVNGSLVRFNLVDQSIDEFYDTSGVDASASTNENRVASGSNFYYDGAIAGTTTEDADSTGTDGLYTWYKWTGTGAGSYSHSGTADHEYLIIAGGGSGGKGNGGGGGAGGYLAATGLSLTGGNTYTPTVGAGGTGPGSSGFGDDGDDSILSGTGITTITTTGGGGGGFGSSAGRTGGSGGGGGYDGSPPGGAGNTPSTTPSQGFTGGAGYTSANYTSGGGGGGGAVGVDAVSASSGDGGIGVQNDIIETGTNVWYAGGGGGGANVSDSRGGNYDTGGVNGGTQGGGGIGTGSGTATAGATNLGAGGGGCNSAAAAGDGGSGVIILRRLTTAGTSVANLTLQSTDVTAEATPTYGEFVTLIENAYGTATLNTDIKGYVSRDSGANFTQGTLVDEGSWGTNKQILGFHDLDISSQPSGTSMCYKITTHNQVASSKETRVYATSIGWR